jgi:nitroimidazol reductase NimA-like FMN-containing flavoprotein (pyridoxamine 5'-phosphate oxidase superfamily)
MSEQHAARILSPARSRELLAQATIGRVVLTADALPTALPVSYVLDHEEIIFRTEIGTISATEQGTVVAFQVDCFEPLHKLGWNVVVTGVARVISDAADIRHIETLAIPTWVALSSTNYIRLSTNLIRGRTIGAQPTNCRPTPV